MDYLSLLQVSVYDQNSSQWVLAKTFRQDIWNFMLKEKLGCFNYWIYYNFKSFICLLGYEHFAFCVFRKIPWTLFSGWKPIFKILQENILKPWKLWIINSWRWQKLWFKFKFMGIYVPDIHYIKKHIRQKTFPKIFFHFQQLRVVHILTKLYWQWNIVLLQLAWHSLWNMELV